MRRMSIVVVVVALAATVAMPGYAAEPRQVVPKQEDKQTLRADHVRQLLVLMDTDTSGKVSKQEWMKFMEAEFDRLDTDHKGQLDVKELTQSRVRVHPFVGK